MGSGNFTVVTYAVETKNCLLIYVVINWNWEFMEYVRSKIEGMRNSITQMLTKAIFV